MYHERYTNIGTKRNINSKETMSMTKRINTSKVLLTTGILAATLVIGVVLWVYYLAPNGYLSIDINPSIEIKTNRLNQVTSIDALNEDAKQLMAGYELTDRNLETVVHNIVDRIILAGYLASDKDNTILITADDSRHSNEISTTVNGIISDYLNQKQILAQVIPQYISLNSQSIKEAHENYVSIGKMAIIKELIAKDNTLSIEKLSSLRISDLIVLAENKGISLAGLLLDTNIYNTKVNNEDQTNTQINTSSDVLLNIEEEGDADQEDTDIEDRDEDHDDNGIKDRKDNEDNDDNDIEDQDNDDIEDNDIEDSPDNDDDDDNDIEDREDNDDNDDNDNEDKDENADNDNNDNEDQDDNQDNNGNDNEDQDDNQDNDDHD